MWRFQSKISSFSQCLLLFQPIKCAFNTNQPQLCPSPGPFLHSAWLEKPQGTKAIAKRLQSSCQQHKGSLTARFWKPSGKALLMILQLYSSELKQHNMFHIYFAKCHIPSSFLPKAHHRTRAAHRSATGITNLLQNSRIQESSNHQLSSIHA